MGFLLFERDLLYPTSNLLDPGILHVELLNPTNSKMPVLIEAKSHHSIIKNIKAIIDIMQKDIFDRINIKQEENVSLYILLNELDKKNFNDSKYLMVVFKSKTDLEFIGLNDIASV